MTVATSGGRLTQSESVTKLILSSVSLRRWCPTYVKSVFTKACEVPISVNKEEDSSCHIHSVMKDQVFDMNDRLTP